MSKEEGGRNSSFSIAVITEDAGDPEMPFLPAVTCVTGICTKPASRVGGLRRYDLAGQIAWHTAR